jgi:hypothetical protein
LDGLGEKRKHDAPRWGEKEKVCASKRSLRQSSTGKRQRAAPLDRRRQITYIFLFSQFPHPSSSETAQCSASAFLK